MNQAIGSTCEELADKISEIFQQGIYINDDVKHYIDSTFSCSDSDNLEIFFNKVFNDKSDMEKEPLIELLLFPDESVQVQLEDILESCEFKNKDIDKILEYLMQKISVIKFQDNQGCINFNFSIPKWAAAQFIFRLNICRNINPIIIQAVNNHVKSYLRNHVKVKLRNSRFINTDNKVYFLCNFFENINTSDDELLQLLDFILDFFGEIKDNITIFKALTQRKKSLFRNLHQAVKFEEQFKNNNMEILLLQGVRSPHINPKDTRKKMDFIDKICVSVFGRTEHIEQVHTCKHYVDNPDAQKIITAFLP